MPTQEGVHKCLGVEVSLASPLDIQQSMFKLAMKSNTLDAMAKPTCLNHRIILAHSFNQHNVFLFFPKYFKLAKIVMVQVLVGVEDEHCFSCLTFCKFKLQNQLTNNLGLVVRMLF